jgi:hypothetical protein
MSLDSLNSLMETLHLLASLEKGAHLARSSAQYRSGEVEERAWGRPRRNLYHRSPASGLLQRVEGPGPGSSAFLAGLLSASSASLRVDPRYPGLYPVRAANTAGSRSGRRST